MDISDVIRSIERYDPFNRQEEIDRLELLRRLKSGEELFSRTNLSAHMTASAWVTDRELTRVLMAYHNIYDSWSWLGGHADGEYDLLSVALREVGEESGLSAVSAATGAILSLEILPVNGHEKRGEYVPSHLHLNLTYHIIADANETLRVKPDENSGVAWFSPKDAVDSSSEEWFRERIYIKLNARVFGPDR